MMFNSSSGYKELLFLTGLFSLILAVDDFFLIHDRYIDERLCYLFYAITIGALLARHFKTIVSVDGFAFLMAGTLLALSVLTELFTDFIKSHFHFPYWGSPAYSQVQIIEEGFKFCGAATWLYFCIRMASSSFTSSDKNL